ncbi:MAG TPA: hypothetical protein VJR03_06490 [Nitrospira sp.]|nr:hypothetical protein [Nitrospira sp.]
MSLSPRCLNQRAYREMWLVGVIATLAFTAISGCETMPTSEPISPPSLSRAEPMAAQTAVVQSLQRQVRERDRRIAELTYQLEALKTIDREADLRREQGRVPAGAGR